MKLHLIANEFRLQLMEMRQYWFETVSGLLFITAMFIGVFYGVKSFAVESQDAQSLDGLVFGFLLWMFASNAYGAITKSLIEDTQRGYIEQLFLCPQGIVRLLLSRALAEMVSGFVVLIVLAYVVMWLTGNWLSINFFALYAILLIGAPALIGLGLFISAFALVFKKVETIGAFLALGLMGIVAMDAFPVNPMTFLPFVPGASLAREVILNGKPLLLEQLAIVIANSGIYLAIGWLTFSRFEQLARKRNLIGQY
ncbi:ABC transporter permease [Alteromonas facilis]|uniref:ABC transporter permease n=1 Tax=Alteromonas facilis TaxID=2048004 RepID=UPI000C294093|nr:ABC transporter permease [Alteromonas facilis]